MDPSSFDVSAVDSTSEFLAALDIIERQNDTKSMESMEVDQIMEVPDIPDRLASQKTNASSDGDQSKVILNNGRVETLNGTRRVNPSCRNSKRWSPNPLSGLQIVNETRPGSSNGHKKPEKDQPGAMVSGGRIFEEVGNRSSQVQPSFSHCSPDVTEFFGLNEKHKIKEEAKGKVSDINNKNMSNNSHSTEGRVMGKRMLLGNGSSSMGRNVRNDFSNFKLQFESRKTEKGCSLGMTHNHVPGAGPIGALQTEATSKTQAADGSYIPANAAPSVKTPNFSLKREVFAQDGAGAGGDLLDPTRGLRCKDNGKSVGPCSGPQCKDGQDGLMWLQSHAPPRRTGQRRLVRNGCISPYNIAKVTSSSQDKGKSAANDKQDGDGIATGGRPSDRTNPSFEGNCAGIEKGKGVMIDAVPTNERGTRTRSSASRDLFVLDEDDIFKFAEEIGGWRSTRNRSKKTSLPASQETKSSIDRSSSLGGNEGNTAGGIEDLRLNNEDPVILEHPGRSKCLVQPSSRVLPVLDQERERNMGVQKLMKRAKKSTSLQNSLGECSDLAIDEPDNSFIQLSERSSNVLPSRTCNSLHRRVGSIIEVDELFTPEVQSNNSDGTDDMVNDASIARARQVEADEEIARQLQEQFYNEMPEVGEIDASIAWTLQHEEDSHATSVGSHHQPHLRDLSMAHLYQHGPRSLRNSSVRSSSHGRVPTSTRMAQLRRSFRGHPPPTSSGGRGFLFPSSMDLEARLQLLEALEAADNAMALTGRDFQVHRDFNEDDYEMLLALDENNHQHGGASVNQINSLPESKVQVAVTLRKHARSAWILLLLVIQFAIYLACINFTKIALIHGCREGKPVQFVSQTSVDSVVLFRAWCFK
ncbi:uncharacterized protein [Aristolochia californica]|uniref:uncharacterized protein isoform X2 n=2 Tax=Aristolochia californica TaxID=171875 RepID=UPI0035D8EA71